MVKLTQYSKISVMRKLKIMKELPFIGRKNELKALNKLLNKVTASLVVIKGRRRIGKSRLIEVFAKGKTFYSFSALAPTKETTAQSQRDEFARQLAEQFGLPGLKAEDWGDLFTLLANQTKNGRIIILIDEITWMGSKDSDFLGKLKIVWDQLFKNNPELILILCGSVSAWIEKNIISSTGFFGRISLKLNLEELSLPECNTLLEALNFRRSPLEKLMYLSLTGGIPWYIELIDPKSPTEENIRSLCFTQSGILVEEFKHIFHDLFGRRAGIYKKIAEYLSKGSAEYHSIATGIKYASGGPLSEYIDELVQSGYIANYCVWDFKTGKETTLCRYRLRDNYLYFYFKYIASNLRKIMKGQFEDINWKSLPGFESIMGIQFEKLVLSNRRLIQKKLNLLPNDIVYDDPYFQNQTTKQKACQIDYLIQTRHKTLMVCEIKFSRNEITTKIITEMQEKLDRLKIPKGFSCCPVLISVSEIHPNVIESNFFSEIIHFEDILLGQD